MDILSSGRSKILLSLFFVVSKCLVGQGLYDLSHVAKIEIWFKESNWNNILIQNKKEESDKRLLCKVRINGELFDSVGVKYKGTSTFNSRNKKNPLNIDLNYRKDQDYQGYKTLKLSNGCFDPSFVREALSYSILKKYMTVPDCNFAKVYVNDKYHGLYSNVEAINQGFIEKSFFIEPRKAFFKCNPEQWGVFASSLEYLGEDSLLYEGKYQLKTKYGWKDLIRLTGVLSGTQDKYGEKIDIDACLWMLAFNNVMVNLDSYSGPLRQNYYLFKNAAGQMVPIPWDMNMSFGGYHQTGNVGDTTGRKNLVELNIFLGADDNAHPLIKQLLAIPTYRKMYLAHARTIVNENIKNGWYNRIAKIIQKEIEEDFRADNNGFYSFSDFERNLSETVGISIQEKTIGVTELVDYRLAYIKSQPWYKDACPEITKVVAPNSFFPNDKILIRAHVSNGHEVFLGYRSSFFEPFKRELMHDDGEHGDLEAGDGVFGVEVTGGNTDFAYYIYAQNKEAGMFSPQRAAHVYHTISVNKEAEVVINEVLASNKNGKKDEEGGYEDWIELYNNSGKEINLEGWFLSDDPTDLDQWVVPKGTKIGSNEYLIIWADNEPGTNALHCNFKLSAKGEVVLLSSPLGDVVDEVTFGEQKQDVSYARFKNGTGSFQNMMPTFGYENSDAVAINAIESKESLRLFPNPATNKVFILYDADYPVTVKVYNLLGDKVLTKDIRANQSVLDISLLSKGQYIFRVGQQSAKLNIH